MQKEKDIIDIKIEMERQKKKERKKWRGSSFLGWSPSIDLKESTDKTIRNSN